MPPESPGPPSRPPRRDFDGLRDRFHVPQHGGQDTAYLCGHSLGLAPKGVEPAVLHEIERWQTRGVEGHFAADGWYEMAERLAPDVAALVGAHTHEVASLNTLTANLHFLMVSFYRPTGGRRKILIESGAFPSDRYAVTTQAQWHGLDPDDVVIEVEPHPGEVTLGTERMVAAIDGAGEELALVLVSGVQYATGERFDLAAVAAAAHGVGALVGFDLAHAVGNVNVDIHASGADFAAWCTYKYCNGGPGSIGGIFVHERHATDPERLRLGGWWGNDPDTRFHMDSERTFVPRPDAASWAVSNPPILSLVPLTVSLAMFGEVGWPALQARSRLLTGHLEQALQQALGERIEILTPASPERRGAQLSVRIPGVDKGLERDLASAGVFVDFRPPDIIRLAPAPLYNTTDDIDMAVSELTRALKSS